MRLSMLTLTVLLAGALLLSACNAPAPAAAPAAAGPAQVTLITNPDPASSAGETELIFEVKGADGQPLSGADVRVQADMVGHSMGVMQGAATDQGNGRYATRVAFSMAGPWKIVVEVRQGDALLAAQDFAISVR